MRRPPNRIPLSGYAEAGLELTRRVVGRSSERPSVVLTRREREVLEHAALGMSNRQIGDELSIAEQTVKNHLSSAMRKLRIHDRTQAVVMALGEGWILMPIGEGNGDRAGATGRSAAK
jgi:DNA-binding NarL/FixJ family response regulator